MLPAILPNKKTLAAKKKKISHSSCYYYDWVKPFCAVYYCLCFSICVYPNNQTYFFTEHSAGKIPHPATATGYVLAHWCITMKSWKKPRTTSGGHFVRSQDLFSSPAIYLFSASSSGSCHGAQIRCNWNGWLAVTWCPINCGTLPVEFGGGKFT